MQELLYAHLYFDGNFYLNFCEKLSILIEANFVALFVAFCKQMQLQKYLRASKIFAINLALIKI